jgi:hypothetical protein
MNNLFVSSEMKYIDSVLKNKLNTTSLKKINKLENVRIYNHKVDNSKENNINNEIVYDNDAQVE